MKIRTRLTLWFTTLVTSLTLISGVTIYISIKRNLNESLLREINNKAKEVQSVIYFLAKEYQKNGSPLQIEDSDIFLHTLSENQGSLYDGVYLQLSKRDKAFARSPNLAYAFLPILPFNTIGQFSLKLTEQSNVNVFYYSTYVEFAGEKIANLQIAIPMTKNEEFMNQLIFYDLMVLLFVFVLSVFIGQFLSYKALKPVSQITDEVGNMEIREFSKRLDTSKLSNDEIGKLAVTFNRLLERIADSIKIQNRFISDASHELRSPLTAIIGHAELLERRGENNPTILKNSSNVIIREGQRLVKLVNDLLYLARSGVKNNDKTEINLSKLIRGTISDIFPFNSQISLLLPEENIYINGDSDSLKRVFINLLNNSLAAIAKDGQIILSLAIKNDFIEILIKDNGIGILEEHLNHLFERFYRVDESRDRKKGGTGLGLAIVYEIIKIHNGKISIESKIGVGSTFIINLPIVMTT
ncbi:MAG: HAMP domain-containing histidine kinase [Candidatus Sericytochromatia bacterium]|nr:HAMP domain-containing histidine kinase [Candidatus Sericytochromatia bacterium]